MAHKTQFQEKWLKHVDCNGDNVPEWAEQDLTDPYRTYCRICDSSFLIEDGFEKINQHASTIEHRSNQLRLAENARKSASELSSKSSSKSHNNFK